MRGSDPAALGLLFLKLAAQSLYMPVFFITAFGIVLYQSSLSTIQISTDRGGGGKGGLLVFIHNRHTEVGGNRSAQADFFNMWYLFLPPCSYIGRTLVMIFKFLNVIEIEIVMKIKYESAHKKT